MSGFAAARTRKALGICFLALILLAFGAFVMETLIITLTQPLRDVSRIRRLLAEERYIIHAGGAMIRDGIRYTYTNSREALENALAAGNRVIELDFIRSRDGYYLCGHDGNVTGEYPWVRGLDAPAALDREDFLNRKMFGAFTPMDLDSVAEVMRERTDFYIVTDVKDDIIAFCETVRERYPELSERFIIQIYHEAEYTPVHDMGFPFIILTLYRWSGDEYLSADPQRIARECELVGFTFPASRYREDTPQNRRFLEIMRGAECPLYVHTVDDREEQRKLFDAGVSAIYTNETENHNYR